MKKSMGWFVGGLVILALLIQLVPYGMEHTNPPVVRDAPWPSSDARSIAQKACYDCHSNESVWPWYSNVAPISWVVQRDVEEGRQKLNFSEWGRGDMEVDEIGEVLDKGEMPPRKYTLIHTTARLTEAEKQTLRQAVMQMGGED